MWAEYLIAARTIGDDVSGLVGTRVANAARRGCADRSRMTDHQRRPHSHITGQRPVHWLVRAAARTWPCLFEQRGGHPPDALKRSGPRAVRRSRAPQDELQCRLPVLTHWVGV